MKARLLTGPPQSEPLGDGRRRLLADLKVDLGTDSRRLIQWARKNYRDDEIYTSHRGTVIFKVPRDFTTTSEGVASIPWWAQGVLGDNDRWEVAGWVHDAACRWQIPRDLADWLFWWIARSGLQNVTPWRALAGWLGLRLGGARAYRNYADRVNTV